MVKIIHTHDQFVRTAMLDPRVARDFFMAHLPEDIREKTDLTNLAPQTRSYINDVRKESIVDVLYKTTISGHEAYLYLLVEHQSKPDLLMAFRLLKYICNIIDEHLKKSKNSKIPLIYPMVIYHAAKPYPYSTDINTLVDAPADLVAQYFLKPFKLIDLGQIEDEILKEHAWAGIMELALKHIYSPHILKRLKPFSPLLRSAYRAGGSNYVGIVLQYLLGRAELRDKDEFFTWINTEISIEVGENMMSLAEQFRSEGKAEGKAESMLEVAERLSLNNTDPILTADITRLPLTQIKKIQQKLNS